MLRVLKDSSIAVYSPADWSEVSIITSVELAYSVMLMKDREEDYRRLMARVVAIWRAEVICWIEIDCVSPCLISITLGTVSLPLRTY